MNHNLRNFCVEMARRTDLSTMPLITYIKVGGVPVAAVFNLIGPKVVEFFVTTYGKAFGRSSVGILLLNYIAKWAMRMVGISICATVGKPLHSLSPA
jgi:hypothetical protein